MIEIVKRGWKVGPTYRWLHAFLVTQTVKNLPAMQESQIRSLGPEGPLEKGMSWRIPWTEEPGGLLYGVAKSRTWTE